MSVRVCVCDNITPRYSSTSLRASQTFLVYCSRSTNVRQSPELKTFRYVCVVSEMERQSSDGGCGVSVWCKYKTGRIVPSGLLWSCYLFAHSGQRISRIIYL